MKNQQANEKRQKIKTKAPQSYSPKFDKSYPRQQPGHINIDTEQ